MMKNIIILIFVLLPWSFLSQNFSITDGSVSTCAGTLFDSGGQGGSGYGNNESYTVTICPDNANDIITLDFINFALDNTGPNPIDNLVIYDGDNTSATSLGSYSTNQLQGLIVTCTSLNTTGCLTLVFTSNAAGTGLFAATITCSTPCQRPVAQAISMPDTIAKICIGESVSFDGSSSYAQGAFNIVDYHWDFDDGTIDSTSGATTSYTFNIEGVYNVQLHVIDDNGCINSNLTDLSIWVAPPPVFSPLDFDTSICIGETVTMTAYPDQYSQTWTATPDFDLGGPAYVPDQVGQCFQSGLEYTSFNPGQTITNINDVLDVCINFEHTFMGDLVISVICPNGQSVVLHQQGGGGTDLGDPITPVGTPGVGWDYCWSPTATNGTWVDNSTTSTMPNNNGGQSLIPGTYESVNPMTGLIGCPLNGTWEIEFCDLWGADDGYAFSWGVNFDPSLYPALTSFTPSVGTLSDSSSWSGQNMTISANGNEIFIEPTTAGSYDYTFSITSDHGCTSDTTITLVVDSPPEIFAGNDTSACSGDLVQLNGEVVNSSPPLPPCTFTLDMVDTWGDGWDPASIDIIINGTPSNFGMLNGFNASYTFTINDGDTWEIVFNSGGIFDYECGYTITDCNGNQVFADGPNPTVTIGSVYTATYGNSVTYVYAWTPSIGLTDTTILDPVSSINGQTDYILNVYPTGHPLCLSVDTVNVNINDPYAGVDSTSYACKSTIALDLYNFLGDTAEVGGDWYNDSLLISNMYDPTLLEGDTFTYIIGNLGCLDTATVILYASTPMPVSSNDTSITVDQQLPLWTSGGVSYIWTPSTYLDCSSCDSVISTPGQDITYYIQVFDSLGCSVVDTINITVEYNPLFIPNGFSPNGDNQNDVLYVRGGGVASVQLQIFDKWGNLVFESFDMDYGWDGTYKGKKLNTGVFVYRMDAQLKNGSNLFRTGNVTLFR